jgi:hypothetical protein
MARLRLRPQGIDDFDALHGLTLSPTTRRFLSGEPSREDSYKRLLIRRSGAIQRPGGSSAKGAGAAAMPAKR